MFLFKPLQQGTLLKNANGDFTQQHYFCGDSSHQQPSTNTDQASTSADQSAINGLPPTPQVFVSAYERYALKHACMKGYLKVHQRHKSLLSFLH